MEKAELDKALAWLRKAINRPTANFRNGQWEAIDALVNQRKRLLVVERTGWGKSLVYFVAARLLRERERGPTLIVSPLLALMRNQIEAARRLGLSALTINSGNRKDWPALKQRILENGADLILVSPERLANDEFVAEVLSPIASRLAMLVIDEAHCISDWGHDFRPDYRRIVSILKTMPANVPVLGTTATANDRVIDDIESQLGNFVIQRGPLMRTTLALQNLRLPDQAARLAWLAEKIPQMPGTGIIYVLTRNDAEQVAGWLSSRGITALPYHSDVEADGFEDSNAYREHLETALLENRIKVLVATTALGMGYDKPDLGFVVHYQAPASIVAYYQQVGRAGRGIDRAVAVLMAGNEDGDIHSFFRRNAFPEQRDVAAILVALGAADGLTLGQLEAQLNLRQGQIDKALKFLAVERGAPVIKDGTLWKRTVNPYDMDRTQIARLISQREREWQEVQKYIDHKGCLMVALAQALDDRVAKPCGKCARCLGRPVVPHDFDRTLAIEASRFLKRAELPLQCKIQVAVGALPRYAFGGNLKQEWRAQPGRILARWGDSGWGGIVAEDRCRAHFRDELVDAAVAMIVHRWKPSPGPKWVTCVPSLRRPTLVADFARRLAAKLGLPFRDAVRKLRNNGEQRFQQNRYHQCRNLDGAFAINGLPSSEPVLLVDDLVDSAWTMTLVAALLLRSGSGPVWPIALATASAGD